MRLRGLPFLLHRNVRSMEALSMDDEAKPLCKKCKAGKFDNKLFLNTFYGSNSVRKMNYP